jgi:hypothetical protein
MTANTTNANPYIAAMKKDFVSAILLSISLVLIISRIHLKSFVAY